MPFENFDNRIKEAADQHHPNYDEGAWSKMNKLLDQHLPEKDDRRRRVIFFLLFFLLLGGGIWLMVGKPWKQTNSTSGIVNTQQANETGSSTGSIKETKEQPSLEGSSVADNKKKNKEEVAQPIVDNYDPGVTNDKKDVATTGNKNNNKQKTGQPLLVADNKINSNSQKKNKTMTGKDKAGQSNIDIAGAGSEKVKKDKSPVIDNHIVSSPGDKNSVTGDEKPKATDQSSSNDVSQNKVSETKQDAPAEQPKADDKKAVAKKSSSKKKNTFFFSVSAGPDISSVGFDDPGEVKLLGGAGFGYTFKDRWTIRTGFYSGHKVYSADRYDYKPDVIPPNFQYLDKIDADCKVYEIPLSLSYNFGRSPKHKFFASTGLSSYIMKEEKYVYLYKYAGGQTYQHTKELENENKHYFSVLTLSGGYERKINNTFSIMAEPYIKLPLAGVGFGNVKLNSVGLLFSVKINPFQQAAKK